MKMEYLVNHLKEAFRQIQNLWVMILVYSAILVLFFIGIWFAASHYGIDPGFFTRDPTASMESNPLMGFVSQFGNLLWCSTATLCFFVSIVFKDILGKDLFRYLLFSGLATFLLLLDDLLLIHDYFGPVTLRIRQDYFYALYLIGGLGFLYFFRKTILKTEFILFVLSLLYFALSVSMDFFDDRNALGHGNSYLIEDGFKFFGIVTWFIYFLRLCMKSIKSKVNLN